MVSIEEEIVTPMWQDRSYLKGNGTQKEDANGIGPGKHPR